MGDVYGPDTPELLRRGARFGNVLDVNGLRITSLPPLPARLQVLDCANTQLTELPDLPDGLLELYCGNTQLSVLPALPPELRTLDCAKTQISVLPVLPAGLLHLDCSDCPYLLIQRNEGESIDDYEARWKEVRTPAPRPEGDIDIDIDMVQIQYTEGVSCYDVLEMEGIPLLVALTKQTPHWVFKVDDTYSCIPKSAISKAGIYFECKEEAFSSVPQSDVLLDVRYNRIQTTSGTFFVTEKNLQSVASFSVLAIEETPKLLPFVTSIGSVRGTTPGLSLTGEPVDIVGADYCQKGSERKVYSLRPITFTMSEPIPDTRPIIPYVPPNRPPNVEPEEEFEEEEEESYPRGYVTMTERPGYPEIVAMPVFVWSDTFENTYYIDASRYGYGRFVRVYYWPTYIPPGMTFIFMNASGVDAKLFSEVPIPPNIRKIEFMSCETMPSTFASPIGGFPPTLESLMIDGVETIQKYRTQGGRRHTFRKKKRSRRKTGWLTHASL